MEEINRKIYILQKHMKTIMGKSKKSISIDDFATAIPIKKPILIRIPYEGQAYNCEVEPVEEDKTVLRIDFTPDKYHVQGLLFSNHDETRKALEVRAMLAHRNLSPTYFDKKISYARMIGEVSASAIREFIRDAVNASQDVDAILLRYISSISRKVDKRFEKYIA